MRLARRGAFVVLAVAFLLAAGAGVAWRLLGRREGGSPALTAAGGPPAPADESTISRWCSQHHASSPPEIFERRVWVKQIDRMYAIAGVPPAGMPGVPPRDGVLAWYQERAPERIEPVRGRGELGPGPLAFRKRSFAPRGVAPTPAVANVRFLKVTDPTRLDLIVSDMRHGRVALQRPYLPDSPLSVLAQVPHPCRAEPVDLDRDGVRDFLVADLGSFLPEDHEKGSVVWLRGGLGGGFTPVKLADGLGRVSDVQPADLDGDGDLDLTVAVFGWRSTGQLLYLENRTRDWSRPSFSGSTLDSRPGAIAAPVIDLDRDGRLDIVVLFAQQFETVEALLGRGPEGPWERRVIWNAPHPAWGSSGIELVDLDGDGDLDILMANGDTLDHSQLVSWQGVRWLENRGGYPFAESLFEQLPGCHAARAADLDGDGDLDIAACAFLPQFSMERARGPLGLESLIWLEQTARGSFARHSIEIHHCDYPTLDVGDFDADGDLDIAVGGYALDPEKLGTVKYWTSIFENLKNG